MDFEEARRIVKDQLTKDRYEHTLRVCETAMNLAEIYRESKKKVILASLFHDYAKCLPKEQLKQLVQTYKLPSQLLDYHHELWHGPVGAKLVEDKHEIKDEDILNAIRFHTTGRPQMSQIELIVFISDYIEPARSFPGLDEVRKLAKENLQKAAQQALKNTIIHLVNKNALIYPDTILAYNDLTKKGVVKR